MAETEREKVFKINELGVKNIAKTCNLKDVKLIHISTDFVFDGMNYEPYKETDKTNPVNNYGLSKIKGELAIKEIHKKYFIIRTSWLYSEYGSNFVKTMLKLSKERNDIKVINDQIGSPTYARDLAEVILHFVNQDLNNFGTYHYCNEGNTTWFDFAKEIFSNFNKEIKVNPIPSKEYKTEALRPNYSTLDTTKIKKALNLKIPNWKTSLSQAVPNFLKSQPDILFKR